MARKYLLKRQRKDERDFKHVFEGVGKLPQKVDLRYKCPAVFDQGELGSCTANAGVAARMIMGNLKTVLSRMFLYYQERALENTISQDSGAQMRDVCKALLKAGVCEEKYCPYDLNKFADAPDAQAVLNAQKYKIGSYKALNSAQEIKQYLASKMMPVLCGIDVFESLESPKVAKTGMVPVPDVEKEKFLGGHAVLIVGYDDNMTTAAGAGVVNKLFGKGQKGAFIVRNSWGAAWGDKGYFYLPYEFFDKKFAFDFWVIQ